MGFGSNSNRELTLFWVVEDIISYNNWFHLQLVNLSEIGLEVLNVNWTETGSGEISAERWSIFVGCKTLNNELRDRRSVQVSSQCFYSCFVVIPERPDAAQ